MPDTIDPNWAWQRYKPSPDNPWDLKKAGHLYRRAAFGATWDELHSAVKAGPDAAIDRLLAGSSPSAEDVATAALMDRNSRQNIGQARGWWLTRMLDGPHPLREKMTLFWHNHFATSFAKVLNAGYMFGQYELMHRHALGNFRDLLQEMSKDPAMMVWLDTVESKKGKPNENYARELMELFSLGIGKYTEADIREAARAFTGWEIQGGKFYFNAKQYDDGEKQFLGKSGRFKGEDIVSICLDQPACPKFVVRKLLRFFISDALELTDALIAPLANQFKASGFNFGKTVETVLRSNLFFSPDAYRAKIKSPVEFTLGIVRGLELRVNRLALAATVEALGQNLFAPPNVKGWDGGPTWLNGQTLLFRQNFALAMSSHDAQYVRTPTPDVVAEPFDLLRKYGKSGDADVVGFLVDLFLQGDLPAETKERLEYYSKQARKQTLPVYWTAEDRDRHPTRALCHLVLTLPEFQLN